MRFYFDGPFLRMPQETCSRESTSLTRTIDCVLSARESLLKDSFLSDVGMRLGVDMNRSFSDYDEVIRTNSPLVLTLGGSTAWVSLLKPGEDGLWCGPGVSRISFDVKNYVTRIENGRFNVLMFPDFDSAVRAAIELYLSRSSPESEIFTLRDDVRYARFLRASCLGWTAYYDSLWGSWFGPDGRIDRSIGPCLPPHEIFWNLCDASANNVLDSGLRFCSRTFPGIVRLRFLKILRKMKVFVSWFFMRRPQSNA